MRDMTVRLKNGRPAWTRRPELIKQSKERAERAREKQRKRA